DGGAVGVGAVAVLTFGVGVGKEGGKALPLGGLEQQFSAQGGGVGALPIVFAAGDVGEKTVAGAVVDRDAKRQRIGHQRAARGEGHLAGGVVAVGGAKGAVPVERRVLGAGDD